MKPQQLLSIEHKMQKFLNSSLQEPQANVKLTQCAVTFVGSTPLSFSAHNSFELQHWKIHLSEDFLPDL